MGAGSSTPIADDPERGPALLGHEHVAVWQKRERPRIGQSFDGGDADGCGRCPENLRCIGQRRGTARRWLLSAAGRGRQDDCEHHDYRGRMHHPRRSGHTQLLAGGQRIIQVRRGFYRREVGGSHSGHIG
jgi:hypothetical protein